ncbi:MAG: c-type cytochrome [Burkholderiaceae bacterium]
MKNIHLLLAPLITVLCAPALAQNVEAGKAKAQQACTVCHGVQGITTMANTPQLAGQPETYLAQQLRDYKSGKRANPVMAVIAQPLTDEEIVNLSAFYASIKIKVDDAK